MAQVKVSAISALSVQVDCLPTRIELTDEVRSGSDCRQNRTGTRLNQAENWRPGMKKAGSPMVATGREHFNARNLDQLPALSARRSLRSSAWRGLWEMSI
jgi:hypothetical protein